MDLSPYIASLREDLATAASAGDENTRRTAAALSAALEPAARLAIMNALSDLAAEVTASLEGQVVEVRLAGRDVQVVVTGSAEPEPEPGPKQEAPPNYGTGDATGDISRITLRMINELKSKAEAAAAAQGMSLNSFIQQAVGGAVHGKHKHHHKGWSGNAGSGSRVRGWVQG